MSLPDARTVPADEISTQRLREVGLIYRLVDPNDRDDADLFLKSEARGFLAARPSEAALDRARGRLADRRSVVVYDPAVPDALPIATGGAWVTPLTVPGGEVPMWAISSITVATSHRRRGIARALLEGELRAAAAAGIAVAGLTVTEATIYGRYGFGPAVPVQKVSVDTRRAGWVGAKPAGTYEYVDRNRLASAMGALHQVARQQRAGQIAGWTARWERLSGLSPDDTRGEAVRGIRYSDASGALRGAMAFTLNENPGTDRYTLKIHHLVAVTPESLAALWHFALHHDLVSTVEADLLPVDDILPWLVADQRAVTATVHDHGWLRILDVPAFFGARTVAAPLDLTVSVDDPLGYAAGLWHLKATIDGRIEATQVDDEDAGADLVIGVEALASVSLGGVSAVQLLDAGRIQGGVDAAAALDTALRPERSPALSIWY